MHFLCRLFRRKVASHSVFWGQNGERCQKGKQLERIIGGSKNVPRTYETLTSLGEKFIPVTYTSPEGKPLRVRYTGKDAFFYDKQMKKYIVRISPEIM